MYYSKEELEEIRKKGEEDFKEIMQGSTSKISKYQSEPGVQIICMHCKNEHFLEGNALLNTRGLTFFGFDWLNESAATLMCNRCGYIHWFGKPVKKIE